ncbi:MAG: chorismate lyase [Gammaproteobacteria bacterium]|nr:chorismate lyase [Gammaproteobacteria bacterium]
MNTVNSNNRATRWKPHRCFLRSSIPAGLSDWLLDRASLTRRLQQLCPGKFRVQVLSQVRDRPRLDEAQVLGMQHREMAIVRQVLLLCGRNPRVYARTVIPVTSLRGKLQRLAGLGTRPLGGVLFADPGMRRGIVELAEILPGQAVFAAATGHMRQRPAAIWGRRSVFRISGKPLLVSEIFLSDFPADRPVVPCWRSR